MTSRFTLALFCVGLLIPACAASPVVEEEDPVETLSVQEALTVKDVKLLAKVAAATAKYHNVNVALADGYVQDPECVVSPAGGMGYHYVNFDLLMQPPQPTKPPILLYEPTKGGGLRLVAVEYFTPVIVGGAPWMGGVDEPPPPGSYNPAPELFGRAFDGPMAGHNPYMPWHYDLHVWLWKYNPNGGFTDYNPRVSCEHAAH
jgi:hypothetical protein